MSVRISTDFKPPSLRARTPGPNQRGVSARPSVSIRFSEPVGVVSTDTLVLRAAGGKAVRASVKYSAGKRRAVLTPKARLRGGARYTVSLGASIADGGGNSVPRKQRRWTFTTRR